MFDLFRSREKTVRILLGGILVVVSLSMLTYLVPNYNTGGSDPSDQVVAQIGKEVISSAEVEKAIDQAVRGRQIPPSVVATYVPQLINQLISSRAMAYEADRLGFQVSDVQLKDAIQNVFPSLFQNGKFIGKDAYASILAQQNTSIDEFEADARRQMLVARLRDVAVAGIVVSPADVEQEFKRKNEKIKVEWVKLTADKYKAESQPSKEDMEAYFKANTSRYQIP